MVLITHEDIPNLVSCSFIILISLGCSPHRHFTLLHNIYYIEIVRCGCCLFIQVARSESVEQTTNSVINIHASGCSGIFMHIDL